MFDSFPVRLAVVIGLTVAAYKFLPKVVPLEAGVVKALSLAIGGVAGATIVAGNVPLVGQLLDGRLPLPVAAAPQA